MSLMSNLCQAAIEVAPAIDQCRVCQRQGLPILVLRQALVPKPASWLDPPTPPANPAIPDMHLGWRTLRAGYLYVLLDEKIWQAYQITPDGYLRQFNPYCPPLANDTPLARACVNADHDLPASLLNIDTDTYRTAMMATADDPWPASVLDAYKAGRNRHRLQAFDLPTARDNPNDIGDFLTADAPRLHDEVYEYQAFEPGFTSVHGFHTRAYRRLALHNFLRTAPSCGALGPGVLAISLEDPVGLVQEYNALRAQWAHARQVWLEEPERAYQQQTSQILLAIRALHRPWADAKVPTVPPTLPQGHFTTEHWKAQRSEQVQNVARRNDERLEERYDESARAAFQAAYDAQLLAYQKQIDRYAALYAQAFACVHFECAMQHDYDGDIRWSGIAYSKTMALCLRGGISDSIGDDDGPTVQLWQKLLKDPNGPVYQALLMRDKPLLAALLPNFNEGGASDWNDSSRLFTLLTKIMTSDEARLLSRTHLQEAIAQILAAMNAASTRLKEVLGNGVARAVSRLNNASQLLYKGVHLIELLLPMKLGDYYALKSHHIRNLQTHRPDGERRKTANTREKINPLVLGGVLSMSVLDPRLANLSINVSVWAHATLEDIKAVMSHEATPTSNHSTLFADTKRVPVIIGLGTLNPQVHGLGKGLMVTSEQARRWVKSGFSGLRGMAGSVDLLVAVGGLYLINEALDKNLQAAELAIGDKSFEAKLALHGSALAALGSGIELVGIAWEAAAKHVPAGNLLLRSGAVIVAVSGFYDAAQASISHQRAMKHGDQAAANYYLFSGTLSVGAAASGIFAAATRATMFMGPLGLAIALGMMAYSFYKLAEAKSSSPWEIWAKRCFFGIANEARKIHWNRSEHAMDALGELNGITLGIQADLEFSHESAMEVYSKHSQLNIYNTLDLNPSWNFKIAYRLTLPFYDENRSGFKWILILHSLNDKSAGDYISGRLLAEGEFSPPSFDSTSESHLTLEAPILLKSMPEGWLDIGQPTIALTTSKHQQNHQIQILSIENSIELETGSGAHTIEAATLKLIYWPDRTALESYAKITSFRIR
jgi:hypothetical protein